MVLWTVLGSWTVNDFLGSPFCATEGKEFILLAVLFLRKSLYCFWPSFSFLGLCRFH